MQGGRSKKRDFIASVLDDHAAASRKIAEGEVWGMGRVALRLREGTGFCAGSALGRVVSGISLSLVVVLLFSEKCV